MIYKMREAPLQVVRARKRVSPRIEEAILILTLLVLDALAIASGFVLAYQVRFNSGLPFSWRFHVADRELNVRAVEAFF